MVTHLGYAHFPLLLHTYMDRLPRRLSQDWIIDESWWGDDDGFTPAPTENGGDEGSLRAAECGAAAAPSVAESGPSDFRQRHRASFITSFMVGPA